MHYDNEEWKPVIGWEGIYAVSNLGRVKTLKRKNILADRIMRTWVHRDGYIKVTFKGDKKVNKSVHRLVLEAFVGKCPTGLAVNHIDHDKSNNCLRNLEYITPLENTRHSYLEGRRTWIGTALRRLAPVGVNELHLAAAIAMVANACGFDLADLVDV